jgi:hypothetical protein
MNKPLKTAVLLVLSVAFLSSTANADGLFLKLPEDGTRVSYTMKITGSTAPPEGVTLSLTISSVGKVEHKGKPCRWIEIDFLQEFMSMRQNSFKKLLISEAELKKGGNPIGHLVKAYRKQGDSPAVEDKNAASNRNGIFPILLAGPVKDAKKLEAVTLETGLGKLESAGLKGTTVFKEAATEDPDPAGEDNSTPEFNLKVDSEFRTHEKVPLAWHRPCLLSKRIRVRTSEPVS